MEAEIEAFEPCDGLQFSQAVRFDLPGEGGELFTGGFLDIREDGTGGLLRGGDIVEVVESYSISVNLVKTELTVNAMFGEFAFTVNADKSLTDEFGRVWNPSEDYSIVDPTGVDSVLGDIDANGTVDFADFLILSSEFGSESEQSDLDGSGMVDFADFLILSANYQTVGT
jgi:hypothetical protein